MPLLDRIPFNHRNRFYHQVTPHHSNPDESVTPNLGPSPPLHQVSFLMLPSLTRLLGYCRTRTLLVPFFRVFPRRGCCHPHLRRQSALSCCLSHHPDVDNVVSADRETSAPTFMIPSRTPCSSASPPQRHGEPGSHWLHQEFHAPASSFSDSHEPYNSALSSPLIYPLVLAFIIIFPAFSQSQTISPALGIGDVSLSLDRTRDYTGTTHQ
jgi:hypothetical protein